MSTYIRYPAEGGGGGIDTYATVADLPLTADNGTLAMVLDTDTLYVYDISTPGWLAIGSPNAVFSIGTLDAGSPSANGAHITAHALVLQSASTTMPGLLLPTAQTLGGGKTLVGASDQVQLKVKGFTGQATKIFQLSKGDDSPIFSVDNDQIVTVNYRLESLGGVHAKDIRVIDFGGTGHESFKVTAGEEGRTIIGYGAPTDAMLNVKGHADEVLLKLQANTVQTTDYLEALANDGTTIKARIDSTGAIFAAAATLVGAISASNFSGSSSGANTGDVTLAAVGSAPSANGASLSGQVLTLQPADASSPGLITAGTQTIGGAKTFSGAISASNLSGTNTGDITLGAIGSSPDAKGATLSSQVLTMQPADATHPGLIAVGAQTIGGSKSITGAADAVQLLITGNGTQTNNIFEVKNSSATLLLGVDHTNSRVKVRGLEFTITSAPIRVDGTSAPLVFTNGSNSELTRMQNTGKWQGWGWYTYDGVGMLDTRIGSTSAVYMMPGTNNGGMTFQSWGAAAYTAGMVKIENNLAANPVLVVRGITSQAGALQEWRNSSETPLLSVTSAGALNLTQLTASLPLQLDGSKNVVSATIASAGVTTATFTAPTVQTFTSGTTYTTPSSPRTPLYLKVRMVGGGGGGGGSGENATGGLAAGGAGGNTTFGSSLLTANGGAGGGISGAQGGAGGTATISAPAITIAARAGGSGSGGGGNATANVYMPGGHGAATPFGGAGGGGSAVQVGQDAIANSGSGGGGGGGNTSSTAFNTGAGGGAGAYVEAIITSPSASYSYAIGAAGAKGTTGTNGRDGGAGAAGYIIVEEFYQ